MHVLPGAMFLSNVSSAMPNYQSEFKRVLQVLTPGHIFNLVKESKTASNMVEIRTRNNIY